MGLKLDRGLVDRFKTDKRLMRLADDIFALEGDDELTQRTISELIGKLSLGRHMALFEIMMDKIHENQKYVVCKLKDPTS